jgi:hypothetical protein
MESDLSVASEVTQARVTEALKVGAETATCQREPGGRYSHNIDMYHDSLFSRH